MFKKDIYKDICQITLIKAKIAQLKVKKAAK